MIQSPFLQEVHCCKNSMKKLRKKIYKFNINKQQNKKKQQIRISDALNVLARRNLPSFLLSQLQKYSDLSLSSLSGFSLSEFQPLCDITSLTNNQEQEITQMYSQTKKNIKKRRSVFPSIKFQRRITAGTQATFSSTNVSESQDISQDQSQIDQSMVFGNVVNNNAFDHQFNNNDAMFQSTMLDFGNQIDMDSEDLFQY